MDNISILESAPFCIFTIDKNYTIKWLNTAGYLFFVADVTGKNISYTISKFQDIQTGIDSVFKTKNAITLTKIELNIIGVGIKNVDMAISVVNATTTDSKNDTALVYITKVNDEESITHSGK